MMGMYVFHPFLIFEENTRDLAFKFGQILGYKGNSAPELLTFLRKQNERALLDGGKKLFDDLEKVYLLFYIPVLTDVLINWKVGHYFFHDWVYEDLVEILELRIFF